MKTFRLIALIGITLCVMLVPAKAGISIVFTSVTGGGSDFTWTYTVSISAGQETTGSLDAAVVNAPITDGITDITLYDIAGLLPNSGATAYGQPTGWTATTQATGDTPGGQSPTDTGAPNITWTYTGTTQITGPLTIGTFSFHSSFGSTASVIATTFQDQVDNAVDGTAGDDFAEAGTSTVVGPHATTTVPEPASVLLLGTLLSLVGFGFRKRSA
jgi:hypothetical protein